VGFESSFQIVVTGANIIFLLFLLLSFSPVCCTEEESSHFRAKKECFRLSRICAREIQCPENERIGAFAYFAYKESKYVIFE
jgi:hypothetical protein